MTGGRRHTGADTGSIVSYRHNQRVLVTNGGDLDHACVLTSRDAMAHRILHQVLHGKPRHRGVPGVVGDPPVQSKTIREPRLLDGQVLTHEREFVLESDLSTTVP